jgi:hypothetical protein
MLFHPTHTRPTHETIQELELEPLSHSKKTTMRLSFQNALLAAAFLTLPLAAALTAQERGYWAAVSNTARSITGDVVLSEEKLTINFVKFPMSRVRALEQSEVSAVFDADSNAPGSGALYRLNIPAAQKFLRKNSLCGGEDTHWMATYTSGRSLRLAFFSGQRPPVFTLEAIGNSSDLCGTFTYGR